MPDPIVPSQFPELLELVFAEFALEGRRVCMLQEVGHHSFVTVEHHVAHGAVVAKKHALVLLLLVLPAALVWDMNFLVGVAG